MKHFVIVTILVVLGTLLVHNGLFSLGLLPAQASLQAVSIDKLFNIHLWLISFVFSLIVGILTYSLVVFRRREGETGDGAYFTGNTRLEVIWTVIPLIVVIILANIGAISLAEVQRIDPSAMVIKVIGGQWFWKFQYPDYGFSSDKLYLPVNQQIDLQMTSQDVIHSFWVPEFRVKQDLVPGRTTELRITPTMIGQYKVRCSELCGTSHAYMEGAVNVVSQEDFDKWVKEQESAAPVDPVLRGQQLAQQYGCANCHSIDGSKKIGPTWKGVADSKVLLSDGSSVIADNTYLTTSIVNPNFQIVSGFNPNIMPSFANTLDQTEVEALVAYIQSLK
jgi:cytochrome c oxidase subunit II